PGGGAIEVTNVATTTGLLPTLEVTGVVVTISDPNNPPPVGDTNVFVAGGDATFTAVTFANTLGHVAGAIQSSSTHLRILAGSSFTGCSSDAGAGAIAVTTDADIAGTHFKDNVGNVGAIDVATTTATLHVAGSTFDGNQGVVAGAVH